MRDQIAGLREEIHDIDEDLKRSGNVDEFIAQRADAENEIKNFQSKLSEAEREVAVEQKYMNQYKNKLDKVISDRSANKAIQEKIEIIKEVKKHFEQKLIFFASTYSTELCNAIQDLLSKMLSATRRVELSSRFELSVKDNYGNEAKSEGQFAIVSFAYIGGILKVLSELTELKGKEYPLVLDGPFSKLDAQHRQNVIDTIPTYAPQVILFSKDDINSCFGSDGIDHVWTIYSNKERNISTVQRGYDPEVFKVDESDN